MSHTKSNLDWLGKRAHEVFLHFTKVFFGLISAWRVVDNVKILNLMCTGDYRRV